MKIKSLSIDGIGGIQHLKLSFIDGVNVICGANGIGKTTILNVIADAFGSHEYSKLKRNALCIEGKYKIEIDVCVHKNRLRTGIDIDPSVNYIRCYKEDAVATFLPYNREYKAGWSEYSKDVFYFGTNRNIDYVKLSTITSDPERNAVDFNKMALIGIQADDIKDWFINRYLFVDKAGSLTENQKANYQIAVKLFSVLDDTVSFKTVAAKSFDIMLTTPKGEIYFEYLSSGYKSCIYIILGMIKEIEYRYSENPICAEDFDGVVLIDEIELHLHPIWQAQLIRALKEIFPKAQFILTTHSPSVLQTLEKEEIIALAYDENRNTTLKELNLGQYGLQGWTLEEILKNIMEMPATTSKLYQDTLKKFDQAMNMEDRDQILQQYDLLKEMLHPDNPLRKLLAIQVAEWED